ncbi:MAG: hypothetical protein LIQ31_07910, partial [Planctomycetes bacterium]|nr:hypothetical protein [Planctomycetota bacterium]
MVTDSDVKNGGRHWLGQSEEAIAAWLRDAGEPAFRAKQFFGWLHISRADSFRAMKNLPAALRARLAADGVVRTFQKRDHRIAADELTEKWLLETGSPTNASSPSQDGDNGNDDGNPDRARHGRNRELVECVLIIEKRRTRRTACLSSMIGCP